MVRRSRTVARRWDSVDRTATTCSSRSTAALRSRVRCVSTHWTGCSHVRGVWPVTTSKIVSMAARQQHFPTVAIKLLTVTTLVCAAALGNKIAFPNLMRFNGAAPEGEFLDLLVPAPCDGTIQMIRLQSLLTCLVVCRPAVVYFHASSAVLPGMCVTACAHLCTVINSRLAMLGCVAAITAELTTQTTVFEQV